MRILYAIVFFPHARARRPPNPHPRSGHLATQRGFPHTYIHIIILATWLTRLLTHVHPRCWRFLPVREFSYPIFFHFGFAPHIYAYYNIVYLPTRFFFQFCLFTHCHVYILYRRAIQVMYTILFHTMREDYVDVWRIYHLGGNDEKKLRKSVTSCLIGHKTWRLEDDDNVEQGSL